MKKLTLVLLVLFTHLVATAQNCDERENKLFDLINNFSSAYLFNTYGLIGSIVDTANAYKDETVEELLKAQQKLATDMSALIRKKLSDSLISTNRTKYLEAFSTILLGFNEQVESYFNVMKNNSRKNRDAYIASRERSWKEISSLMGIKEND